MAAAALATLAACNNDNHDAAEVPVVLNFEATIQPTSYGVPHISASTLSGAAYGVAYAYAQDNLCLLADQVLTNAGERSRHFGPDAVVRPGSTLTNIRSDLANRYLLDAAAQTQLYAAVSAEAKLMVAGDVAGYNRFVRERAANLPAPCTDRKSVV